MESLSESIKAVAKAVGVFGLCLIIAPHVIAGLIISFMALMLLGALFMAIDFAIEKLGM